MEAPTKVKLNIPKLAFDKLPQTGEHHHTGMPEVLAQSPLKVKLLTRFISTILRVSF